MRRVAHGPPVWLGRRHVGNSVLVTVCTLGVGLYNTLLTDVVTAVRS